MIITIQKIACLKHAPPKRAITKQHHVDRASDPDVGDQRKQLAGKTAGERAIGKRVEKRRRNEITDHPQAADPQRERDGV